ncbi:MAG: disulfide bond formation protein DsbB [Enterobacterales bacterium]
MCHELFITAFYFEIYLGLEPCPLCMVSRAVVFTLGIFFLLAALHNPSGFTRKIYHGILSLISALGVVASTRHVYLQSLPADEVPSCGPSLNYMLDTLPMSEVLKKLMEGSGSCAESSWEFMALSMPAWMLIIFSGFLIISLYPLFKRERTKIFSDN